MRKNGQINISMVLRNSKNVSQASNTSAKIIKGMLKVTILVALAHS